MKNHNVLEIFKNNLRYLNYSNNTIDMYCFFVNEYIIKIKKDPYNLTYSDLNTYLNNYKFSSISKQNQVISSLKKYYEIILKKSDIHLDKIKRPRKEKRLPQIIEKDFLLEKISKIENLKHKAIISLAFSTGMRVSEIINLKISDIDSTRMIINIIQAKGRKDRIVPLSTKILELLRSYYKEYKPKDYMFNGQNSQQYSSESCNKLVKKYIGNSFHFHLLRHSCFTTLLECGTDLRIIQSIAGHQNVKTTEIYTHVSTNLLNKVNLPI